MNISEVQTKLAPLLKEYGIKKASVFGSVSRGEATEHSDVDILITLGEKPMGVFTFMELIRRSEEMLGRKIDMVSESAINKFVKPYILKDLKTIYEG